MWMTWQTDANPQHWITVLWIKVRREKRSFPGKSRSLLVEYDYQLPLFCFPDLVQSSRCIFPLVCWVPLLHLDPCCLWANTPIKRRRRELYALLGQCLGRLWRMQVGKQTQLSPGRQISVSESFPRHRNLCGFLSVCSINSHSSHWKEC